MGSSKELFIRMSEQEYLAIPDDIRAGHLASKVYNESLHDFQELMEDSEYARLYKIKKDASKQLDERQYYLREQKRKNQNQ